MWWRQKRKGYKGNLDCKFIKINPDGKDYDEYVEFSKIINHINESNEELTKESAKKSLIDKISERLLELKFDSNHSLNSKALK